MFDNQQGGYKFPTNATLPDIAFAVGDTIYKVCRAASNGPCASSDNS